MRVRSDFLRALGAAALAALLAASLAGSAAGADAPAGKRCGAIQGGLCDAGDYCLKATGACSRLGALGVCTHKPDVCMQVLKPVCGCDGHTYSNSACAAVAGVSVLHDGECAAPRTLQH
jgi:hypothetical protein